MSRMRLLIVSGRTSPSSWSAPSSRLSWVPPGAPPSSCTPSKANSGSAIAGSPSATSRGLSYGTIYTTKLLRRGTDIDRTSPWRALADPKIADAMRAFRPPLPVPPADGGSTAPDRTGILGPVTYQADPQALFATESLVQALRQVEAYGHHGLPILYADGRQIPGWVTAPDVLRAIARQLTTARVRSQQAQAAAYWDHADPGALPERPPTPLPG